MNEEIPYRTPAMDEYFREGARKNSALLRKMQGKPAATETAETKPDCAPRTGSVAVAGDVVMVGPYPDKLHKCDECGALVPWLLMHVSPKSPLVEVCKECRDKGH